MKITVDARGCGEGKTTTGIYPLIERAVKYTQLTLVVVPSIRLQQEYQKRFGNQVLVINGFGAVNQAIDAVINRSYSVVIITTECWMRLSVSDPIKSQWNLIFDETIMPFRTIRYDRRHSRFAWTDIITARLTPEELQYDDVSYWPIIINEQRIDNWTRTSEAIQHLLDERYESFAGQKTLFQLTTETAAGRVEIFQQLRIGTVLGWASLHIAAAAFEYTMMAAWFRRAGLTWNTIQEFTHRDLPVRFHHIVGLNWSKSKQLSPEYRVLQQEYLDYVNKYCAEHNLKPLALRNNSNSLTLENEIKINHNPHGWNELKDSAAISIETALNPSKEFNRWLRDYIGMTDKEITVAFSSYLFYQAIMRTRLRNQGNTDVVDVFVLDEKTLSGLFEFICSGLESADQVSEMNIAIPSAYIKRTPMTATERSLKRYYKNKNLHENHNTLYENRAITNTSAVLQTFTSSVRK